MVDESAVLDLDAARASRSGTKGKPIPLRFGGEIICYLPAELPVDVLEPLAHLNVDTALIARTVLHAMKEADLTKAGLSIASMVVDLVIQNPKLPGELLDAVRWMGRRLMGEDGYEQFVAQRPSVADVAAFIKGLGGRYSFRLGESMPSSSDSDSGESSTPTSSITSTDSTSLESGSSQASEGGYLPADSSTSPTSSLPTPE
ncbi:hypothetical protein [Nonomuraea basaltis]|uniref:hypothetical protein n=1 Tax=Nonomuraea basaltis TaxID=2495887 RepID=UPI00110C5AC7|nr:hypothetical protein [Nonomuraea basaltis]TMR93291.1 hypothetical protein EJK15_40020 [Nonomuraea basaltis]